MKQFSIFDCALKFSSLQQSKNQAQVASLMRRDFEARESFACYMTIASVEHACLMIENALLLKSQRGGRVYAGFEKLSSLRPVMECYLRIADLSEAVYLFGVDDWAPRRHPNIRQVSLAPDFCLAHEFFLITQSSSMKTAFVARNEELMDKGNQRVYGAFKSSDANIVTNLANAIEGVIDWTLAA